MSKLYFKREDVLKVVEDAKKATLDQRRATFGQYLVGGDDFSENLPIDVFEDFLKLGATQIIVDFEPRQIHFGYVKPKAAVATLKTLKRGWRGLISLKQSLLSIVGKELGDRERLHGWQHEFTMTPRVTTMSFIEKGKARGAKCKSATKFPIGR